jgi:hypothetical protein
MQKFNLSDRSATHDQRHSMMEQKEQQNDNWDWHAKQPKQNSTTHDVLLWE